MKKCGIYIIKNIVNDKVYIGQSVNIDARWIVHKSLGRPNTKPAAFKTKIYPVMRDLGVENFYLEILELCPFYELDDREIYWIHKYDSYRNGYNMTEGGKSHIGSANGRAILNEEQVFEIRSMYGEKIPFREAYKKFEGIISKRGFQKVWHFETWLHIAPEVYTEENRIWHKTEAKKHEKGNTNLGKNNAARACTEEEIRAMRELRSQNLSYTEISKRVGRSASVVRKYCLFENASEPQSGGPGIKLKNVETGLHFPSLSAASQWARCDTKTIKSHLDKETHAGTVPTTGEPASWISL